MQQYWQKPKTILQNYDLILKKQPKIVQRKKLLSSCFLLSGLSITVY